MYIQKNSTTQIKIHSLYFHYFKKSKLIQANVNITVCHLISGDTFLVKNDC